MFTKFIAAAALAASVVVAGQMPAAAAVFEFVSAKTNGVLITRSAGAVSVVLRGTGIYEVKFRFPMEKCAYTATTKTQGDPLDVEGQDQTGRKPYFIQTAYTPRSPSLFGSTDFSKSVFVIIHNKDGLRVNKGFDLHVACP